MVGIETLKKDLSTLTKIVGKIDKALEDDKISVSEGVGIAFSAVDLIKVVKTFKEAYAELIDLDENERDELVEYFKAEFDIRNDDAEEIIERIIELALTIVDAMGIVN